MAFVCRGRYGLAWTSRGDAEHDGDAFLLETPDNPKGMSSSSSDSFRADVWIANFSLFDDRLASGSSSSSSSSVPDSIILFPPSGSWSLSEDSVPLSSPSPSEKDRASNAGCPKRK